MDMSCVRNFWKAVVDGSQRHFAPAHVAHTVRCITNTLDYEIAVYSSTVRVQLSRPALKVALKGREENSSKLLPFSVPHRTALKSTDVLDHRCRVPRETSPVY